MGAADRAVISDYLESIREIERRVQKTEKQDLSRLALPEAIWLDALREAFAPDFFPANEKAFQLGRSVKAA